MWWETDKEFIEDCTYLVDVTCLTHSFTKKHFWCEVCRTSTERLCLTLVIDSFFSKPEISQLYMTFDIDQNILWLQVSVNDVQRVYVFHGQNYLSYIKPSLILIEDLPFVKMKGKITSRAIVKDHV